MRSRGAARTVTVVVLGLLAATLYAGTAPGASAAGSACAVSGPTPGRDSGRNVPVGDARYEYSDSRSAAVCATALAGALCTGVLQTTAPLLRTRAPGSTGLCTAITLLAHWGAAGSAP